MSTRLPWGRKASVVGAIPAAFSVTVNASPLSARNVTAPVGTRLPGPATVAVKSAAWPYPRAAGVTVSVVVAVTGSTVCVTGSEWLARKLLLPT